LCFLGTINQNEFDKVILYQLPFINVRFKYLKKLNLNNQMGLKLLSVISEQTEGLGYNLSVIFEFKINLFFK
jgi:hypothetical protein